MGLGARGAWAALLLGTLQVLALLGAATDPSDPSASANKGNSVPQQNSSANATENIQHVLLNSTSKPSNSTVKPTAPLSSVVSSIKPTATSKTTTSGVASTNMTSTTLKSTPKTSVSQNTSQMSTSTMTTTHNSLVTSLSSSITITATIHSKEKGSKFDTGSFVGGIVLTLGVLSILYIGCKMYYSRRGIRYRTIDEHDAII
ncbi:porimin [Lemur catta]|uniref:porimin n=1 Tax=Lemur catta TaxID=9447 RepID=UPI001E26A732|nr:porimin [Lemur catta]